MIRKFRFGNPYETEAVVHNIELTVGEFPYFYLKEESTPILYYRMENEDRVYGLGENVRGINKRGWLYESYCKDDSNHSESKHSLYGAHNFFVVDGDKTFGIFVDCPSKVSFDIGYSKIDEFKIQIDCWNFDWYVIDGETVLEIIKEFRQLIGRSYIPPKWAFGYQQSRWGYASCEDIEDVVEGHRKNQIPLDAVYLDIDYMDSYKNFTVDEERFPDFTQFVSDMKKKGIHLVPIIDAGVKVENGYDVYEEGVAKGYFCKEADSNEFTGGVWPGKVHFPDMLNEDARAWFGHKYKVLLDYGIDGFWNDMNEPAIFYSEENLQQVLENIEDYKDDNIDVQKFFALRGMVNGLANNPDDYTRFYHHIKGKMVRHDKVHNLYGYNMTRAAAEAFEQLEPNKRILLFSRSSYIGMHRYGGIWMGDNKSWWSHLLLSVKMLPSLNMCGVLYTGADIGGFNGDTTEDLLLRWIQFAIFTPLMRNHSALGTRRQEVYQFTKVEAFRNLIGIRYGLIPYLYSEFVKAAIDGDMYAKPLALVYPDDEMAKEVEDQLVIGDGIMVAPIYEQNRTGRYVYLPEPMLLIKMKSLKQRECQVLGAGHHYVNCELTELVFFVRQNHIILLAEEAQTVEELKEDRLEAIGYLERSAHYVMYQDDGISKDYENPAHYFYLSVRKDGSYQVEGSRKIDLYTTIYLK